MRGGELSDISLVINMQGFAPSQELSKGDIEAAMEMKVASTLPFDPKLFVRMESEGIHMSKDKDGVEIMKSAFMPLMQKLLKVNPTQSEVSAKGDKDGIFSGILGKLGSKK